MPNVGPLFNLAKVAAVGAIGLYVATNSLYNVEGGHRAIVFNRLEGIRDKVSSPLHFDLSFFRCYIHYILHSYCQATITITISLTTTTPPVLEQNP